MLKVRLARGGSHKRPFFRIVLTEHTKPVKSGYKEVLGWYNPLSHETQADIETIKSWIAKGAQPSDRVAKILFKFSNDSFFEKYVTHSDRVRKPKNAPAEEAPVEATPAEAAPVAETLVEAAPAEETPVEAAPAEETPAEEVNKDA